MVILNNIAVSFPDTITIATTPREAFFHSCPSAATDYDFLVVLTICVTILLSLIIIALTVGYSISINNSSKLVELKKRNSHELTKLENEYCWKRKKDIYDSVWRTINHAWEESKEKQQQSNVDEAWEFIKNLWKLEMPVKNNDSGKSQQPKS